jgi:hypothetical protein
MNVIFQTSVSCDKIVLFSRQNELLRWEYKVDVLTILLFHFLCLKIDIKRTLTAHQNDMKFVTWDNV